MWPNVTGDVIPTISNDTDLVIVNPDDLSITINQTHPLITSNTTNSSTLAQYEGLNFVQRVCLPVSSSKIKCHCPTTR